MKTVGGILLPPNYLMKCAECFTEKMKTEKTTYPSCLKGWLKNGEKVCKYFYICWNFYQVSSTVIETYKSKIFEIGGMIVL